MTHPEFIEAINHRRDQVAAWLKENFPAKAGTDECRKMLVAHRLLTDLIDLEGGTPEQREYVMRKLNE